MIEERPEVPALAWDEESGGVVWHVELDRAVLLPGRLVGGRIVLVARRSLEARALRVQLVGVEHWRHRVTRPGPNGQTRTEVVTSRAELPRVPEVLHGPLRLAAGERWETAFDLPVPPLGPATLDARDAGVGWRFEAKLDVDNALDSRTERPVLMAQPTALLRAGSVRVGQFALYESVDVAAGGITGSIALEPMPLVTGEPFTGRVALELGKSMKVQEIRAELRVHVEATVSGGQEESMAAWSGVVASAGTYDGALDLPLSGVLDPRPLPTIVLAHGQAQATFHVVLATAWSRDTHLVRDVAIATTREL